MTLDFQPLSFLRTNLIPQVTETNFKQTPMATMQNPCEGQISCQVLQKMSIQEKNNAINQVAERTKNLFHQKQPSPNQKMKYLAR